MLVGNLRIVAFQSAPIVVSLLTEAVHLVLFVGVIISLIAIAILCESLREGPASEWAVLALLGAAATGIVATVLLAIGGIGLNGVLLSNTINPTSSALLAITAITVGLLITATLMASFVLFTCGAALLLHSGVVVEPSNRRIPLWFGLAALSGAAVSGLSAISIAIVGFVPTVEGSLVALQLLLSFWLLGLGVSDLSFLDKHGSVTVEGNETHEDTAGVES